MKKDRLGMRPRGLSFWQDFATLALMAGIAAAEIALTGVRRVTP
jgi:hypothetical protein